MPSRSRHSRNHSNHSNRSPNKHSTRRNNIGSKSTESKQSECRESIHNTEHNQTSILHLEEQIIYEFTEGTLSIHELSQLLEKYVHRKNANALFLFQLICEWTSNRNCNAYESESNLLFHSESCHKIRNSLLKVLFGLTDKVSFKNIVNQNAWSLAIIKLLSSGLPTLCSALIHWLAKHIKCSHSSSNHLQQDQLRFIVMFLRPEIVEQCAFMVQFNASIFEEAFCELIEALADNYQPFRIWLFARLCSQKRQLIEPQLAKFICFGQPIVCSSSSKQKQKQKKTFSQRCKSLIVNEYDDDNKEDEDAQEGLMNLDRLMNAFKASLAASNQLVINNQSRTFYELGVYCVCLFVF